MLPVPNEVSVPNETHEPTLKTIEIAVPKRPVIAPSPVYEPVSRYAAKSGESLEDVLRSWSNAEGVGFLWKTTQRYDVAGAVSGGNGFAQSVETLLSQYSAQDVRPIGKLHTDPLTGTRTLSVYSE